MRVAELIMLIAGAVLFTVSFFMPDKKSAGLDKEEEKKQIKKLLDEEAGDAKYKIEEVVDECVSDGKDRTERALDRITNEKISAINEYSDTVLEQIKKNHDEVMFLYDMLNNKHSQVKNTAAELNQITRSAKHAAQENVQTQQSFGYVTPNPERNEGNMGFGYTEPHNQPAITEPKNNGLSDMFANKPVTPAMTKEEKSNMTPRVESVVKTSPATQFVEPGSVSKQPDVKTVKADSAKKTVTEMADNKAEEKKLFEQIQMVSSKGTASAGETKKKTTKAKQTKVPVADGNLELMFATDRNLANNNDRILELHKAGKSNMAIAKELGLGVGEVKLVIDLFEGI